MRWIQVTGNNSYIEQITQNNSSQLIIWIQYIDGNESSRFTQVSFEYDLKSEPIVIMMCEGGEDGCHGDHAEYLKLTQGLMHIGGSLTSLEPSRYSGFWARKEGRI